MTDMSEGWAAPAGTGSSRAERRAQKQAAAKERSANIKLIKQWTKESKPTLKVGTPPFPVNVLIWDDRIANKQTGEIYPLSGVVAEYEDDGAVTSRVTASRAITGIGLFFPKQVDKSHGYITITGPKFVWTVDMGEGRMMKNSARKLAASVNSHIKQQTAVL